MKSKFVRILSHWMLQKNTGIKVIVFDYWFPFWIYFSFLILVDRSDRIVKNGLSIIDSFVLNHGKEGQFCFPVIEKMVYNYLKTWYRNNWGSKRNYWRFPGFNPLRPQLDPPAGKDPEKIRWSPVHSSRKKANLSAGRRRNSWNLCRQGCYC